MKPKPIWALLFAILVLYACVSKNTSKEEINQYTPDWESLKTHETPKWFTDGKFGIYFHWGIYSVPAYKTEWYPRLMYLEMESGWGSDVRPHHIEKYGEDFQYHDFIPEFTAEHFDAEEWAKLFKASGARYAGPVAEHHDNFSMWDSKVNPWNAAKMGPKRDIVGELEKAIKAQDLKFVTTLHHHMNWGWYSTWNGLADTSTAELKAFYGEKLHPDAFINYDKYPMSEEFVETWKNKIYEVIENYEPDMLWFDGRMNHVPEEARIEMLTRYYNHAEKIGKEVVVNYKKTDLPVGTGVLDIERGRMKGIVDYPWLTDDSWTWKGWAYSPEHEYKTANNIVDGLIDIVSKNGCLLLNIGPRADGTIPEQVRTGLLEVGEWMNDNGEAIYETRPFFVYGEGKAKMTENHFGGVNDKGVTYKASDVRYTKKDNSLYIIQLGSPEPGQEVVLQSFATDSIASDTKITNIELIGSGEKIKWIKSSDGLHLVAPKKNPNKLALVYKAEIKN